MKKSYLLFFLILASGQLLFAQSLIKEEEIVITVGATATKLVNTNIDNDNYKVVDKQPGGNVNFSYNRYFKNRIGFGIGIGFSNYNQTVYQKGLFVKSDQTDDDGYKYDLWMISDMTYTTHVNYVDIPIMLHLLLGHSDRFYGFIDAGIVNGFLVEGTYTKKGSIENRGSYPSSSYYFDVVSHNNPYYGHQPRSYDKEYTDKYKSYNVSFRASFGIAAALTDRMFLRVAPEITKGFSDITAKDDEGKDYENVFAEKSTYKPTKIFSLGLNVGFVFNL